MHPVLLTLPSLLLKILVPAAVLVGLALVGRAALQRFRARSSPSEQPLSAWWDGLVLIAVGIGLFLVCAPVTVPSGGITERLLLSLRAFATGITSASVWNTPWTSIPVYSYGVMLGLSFVLGWQLSLRLAQRYGLDRDAMREVYIVTAVTALVGSRVLYVVTNLHEFRDAQGHFALELMVSARTGGAAAYGGFLGGWLGAWSMLKVQKQPARVFWTWADAAVPSVVLGTAVTRIGCYLYGCDFGRPLAVDAPGWLRTIGTFPRWADGHGSSAWLQHRVHGFLTDSTTCLQVHGGQYRDGMCYLRNTAVHSVAVHPTQLYESATCFLLALLAWRTSRVRRFEGQVFLLLAMSYGVARSLLETVRDDRERGFFLGVSTSQWIGMTTAAVAAGLYYQRRNKHPVSTTPNTRPAASMN